MVIYINTKLGMVLKAPMCIIGKEKEGITLPTIHIGFGWVLQPLCTFDRRTEAVQELADRVGPAAIKSFDYDLHYRNIARFEGVAYLFDW